ncbi:Uncharacterised protein [BD1-7 clade bacterium]|uniref:Uncharacterized protein n=1 Tax=BD1-7 clade bacterium TaxID=2029982 RepID=A0A5S9PXZ8_9GAMM|nr:Uncharacterised protein [BD1-7 clade bacterium]CAA0109621.1 Uncharacterised protein [BD1-7 clade bacterium]
MYPIVYPKAAEKQERIDTLLARQQTVDLSYENLKDARERRLCIIYDKPAWFQIADNHALNPGDPILERKSCTPPTLKFINLASELYGVDRHLILAIVVMETNSCFDVWPDRMREYRKPMGVSFDLWEELAGSERYIKDPANNIEVGTLIVSRIQKKIRDPSVGKIASVFHQLDATVVNDYGAKVARLYQLLRRLG